MRSLVGIALALFCINSQASSVEDIHQALMAGPQEALWSRAAQGDTQAMEEIGLWSTHRSLCTQPRNESRCNVAPYDAFPQAGTFGHQLLQEVAAIKFRSIQHQNRLYAERIAEINNLVESCNANKRRLFEGNFTETCHEKVTCRGEQAIRLRELMQSGAGQQFGLRSSTRELAPEEQALVEGMRPQDIHWLQVHYNHIWSTGGTSSQINVNGELLRRMEQEWARIERDIERNPNGLMGISDALEESGDEIGDAEVFSAILLRDVEAARAGLDALVANTAIKQSDLAIAQRQVQNAQTRMARFMRRNQHRFLNPITQTRLTVDNNFNLPAGIMVPHAYSCWSEKTEEGTTVRSQPETCEVVIGNAPRTMENDNFQGFPKFRNDQFERQAYNVHNRCLSPAPVEFFRNLFRGRSQQRPQNDSDRSVPRTVTPDAPETVPTESGAVQQ